MGCCWKGSTEQTFSMNLLYGCFRGSGGYVNSNKIVLEGLPDKES